MVRSLASLVMTLLDLLVLEPHSTHSFLFTTRAFPACHYQILRFAQDDNKGLP